MKNCISPLRNADFLDKKYRDLQNDLGNIGENKLLLISAIKIIDEFFDLKKKVNSKKNEFQELSKKFKEIKFLATNYRDEKENEISKLKEEINKLEIMIEDSKKLYENMLDRTTKSIQDFIENNESEKNIQ